MTVYVDDMYTTTMGRFRRGGRTMKMSHMMSDTPGELTAMAEKIGLKKGWLQNRGQGRHREHYDVSMSMRERAIEAGAVPVTWRELGQLCFRWRTDDRGGDQ